MKKYKYNPYRIVRSGENRFKKVMKKSAPRIRHKTLDEIFNHAKTSVINKREPRQIDFLEIELVHCWQDLNLFLDRKKQAATVMEGLYEEVRALDPKLPAACKGIISSFHLARIIAESGPLGDFSNWRKLMRFAGLNLCERQSGTWRGKTKVSKKGRRLLRKVLGQVVFHLTPKDQLYGAYYHKKKETMPGNKAMTVIALHFLKMLYGVYKSGNGFDKKRIFTCESQLDLAA
jgi:transposase